MLWFIVLEYCIALYCARQPGLRDGIADIVANSRIRSLNEREQQLFKRIWLLLGRSS